MKPGLIAVPSMPSFGFANPARRELLGAFRERERRHVLVVRRAVEPVFDRMRTPDASDSRFNSTRIASEKRGRALDERLASELAHLLQMRQH